MALLTLTSIPQLKLMAAVLGLHATTSIVKILGLSMSQVWFWSDSMNVLCWVRGRGHQFCLFVANHIGEIQNSTDPEQWQYISTKENLADLCSRGSSAQELAQNELRWNGPSF